MWCLVFKKDLHFNSPFILWCVLPLASFIARYIYYIYCYAALQLWNFYWNSKSLIKPFIIHNVQCESMWLFALGTWFRVSGSVRTSTALVIEKRIKNSFDLQCKLIKHTSVSDVQCFTFTYLSLYNANIISIVFPMSRV